MKRIHHVQAVAALFVSAAFLVSCAKTDSPIDESLQPPEAPQAVTFTATLAPKGEDPGTKAITTGKDGENKEILIVKWKENEKIAIYYQKTDDTYATATATVDEVDNETGAATISATLPDAKDNCEAKFVYPASLANATGGIDESQLLNNQNGLLRTGTTNISKNFDAATATGTIAVAGGEATVSGSITMQNQVCICKFHFDLDDGTGSSISGGSERTFSPIIINDGNGHTYTITSNFVDDGVAQPVGGTPVYRGFKSTDDIYIAMLPVSGKTAVFYNSSLGSMGYNNYLKVAPNTTLTAGKFYRNISLTLTKDDYSATQFTFKDLSASSITAVAGDFIYQSNNEATANTITIGDGANVRLHGVNISSSASSGIICSGSATINLSGSNTVTATTNHYAAIQPGGTGETLAINGSGSLTVTGGGDGAGIGTGKGGTCGNIYISGGTILAHGGKNGAGIGTGYEGTCGNIYISGGSIETYGESGRAAGLGCGTGGTCGDITITNGVTRVYARTFYIHYCIGKGGNSDMKSSSCGTITIGGIVRSQEDFNTAAFTYQP